MSQPIPVISSTGLYTPKDSISNEELVASFNAYVDKYNAANPDAEPLTHSSVEFIEKASGIKSRHVIDKASVLDPDIMGRVLNRAVMIRFRSWRKSA